MSLYTSIFFIQIYGYYLIFHNELFINNLLIIYTKPLATRQVTQENLLKKTSSIDKKIVTFKPQKKKTARGLQLDEKSTPIHQMRILKLQKEEKRPSKLCNILN
jgi:hypothetical protein